MTESTVVCLPSPEGVEDPLTEVLRAGAQHLLRHAVEAEVCGASIRVRRQRQSR